MTITDFTNYSFACGFTKHVLALFILTSEGIKHMAGPDRKKKSLGEKEVIEIK